MTINELLKEQAIIARDFQDHLINEFKKTIMEEGFDKARDPLKTKIHEIVSIYVKGSLKLGVKWINGF